MDPALRLLRRLQPHLGDTAYSRRPSVLPVPMSVSAGVETQDDPRRYAWDGLARSWDTRVPSGQPHAILQVTLAGEGRYADARGERRISPGSGFIALVPSAHRYWLPQGATWTFAWFAVAHPQIIPRLQSVVERQGAFFACDPSGAVAQRHAEIVEGLFRESLLDDFALEAALWDVLHELDRQADRLLRPPEPKQDLLERVRAIVLADLAHDDGTAGIARQLGWHRVHFANRFRSITGFTPAAYIVSLRLEEARRRLRASSESLEAVAKATGLGSASRLCRLFRKHYGGTPGRFRETAR
jgi:AraC family transcriptional regulator